MDLFLEEALEAAERAVQRVRIPTSDGLTLAATVVRPLVEQGPPRVVVVNSATGVPRRYYDRFASYLAEAGFTVLTYDYRGIGGSRPRTLRGFRARMRDWGERYFDAALRYAIEDLGCAAPLVIGHSVGGQLVGLAPRADQISALLFVGAQSGEMRLWPAASRLRLQVFFHAIVPSLTSTLGYLPGVTLGGEDLPSGVAREWGRWARRPGYLAGGRDAWRKRMYARLSQPLLAYAIDDDEFAPGEAVRALLGLYANARSSVRAVAPADVGERSIGHFGFFRPRFRDTLWREARDFLEAQHAVAPALRAVRAA